MAYRPKTAKIIIEVAIYLSRKARWTNTVRVKTEIKVRVRFMLKVMVTHLLADK